MSGREAAALGLDWRSALGTLAPHSTLRRDYPLAQATSLGVGGPAACLVDVESEEELSALLGLARGRGVPLLMLGKGSNLLAPDEGWPGLAIRLGRAFGQVERLSSSENRVWAGAGISNAVLVRAMRRWGLGGMEYLMAIPGTLGGALAMNAGAHGQETANFVRRVRVMRLDTGKAADHPAQDFVFGYRASPLRGDKGLLALGAELEPRPMALEQMEQAEAAIRSQRTATQPKEYPNCGSVFKNPPGQFAARLIQEAGLKGLRQGGAQVSEKHANFIVNRGGAKAAEVMALINIIRQTVWGRFQVALELEVQWLGAPEALESLNGVKG